MSDDGAVFKGAGSFRVDRAHALEKLSAFGLEKPGLYTLPWVRCAVAAKARTLSLDPGYGLTLRFDGEAFTKDELSDPYGALFAVDPEPRLRHFALGLLGCLRTGPSEVVVESGPGALRMRLRARSTHEDSLEPAPGEDDDTLIRVRWPPWRFLGKALGAMWEARQACPLVPSEFSFEGASPLPGRQPPHCSSEFVAGPVRGLLHLPDPGAPHSVVTLCAYGVEVETIKTWLPWAQVRAWVNDDGFALTASQASVVEDDRRKAALDALAEASGAFLRDGLTALDDLREGLASSALMPWMLEAAGRLLSDPAADDARPLLKALWDAPLFLDAAGRPLSLRALADQKGRLGYAAFSRADSPGATPPERIAWCPDAPSLACLKARFGAGLRDVTELIESLERAK